MEAFSYLRVSGLCQVQGDGLERQRESVAKYASAFGYTVKMEFRDEGVSGTRETFDRPALTDLFAAVRSNGVRVVLVERSDRVARDLMVGELILEEFRKLEVRVIEAEGGQELTVNDGEPTKVLIRQVLGAMAQFDKAITVQKLKAARLRKRARGERCEGGKPFGEMEGEKAVLEQIRGFRESGMTIVQIVMNLNAGGVKARKEGGRWHPTSVGRLLRRISVDQAGKPCEKQKCENLPVPSSLSDSLPRSNQLASISPGEQSGL